MVRVSQQDEKSILSCFDEGWEISGAPDDRRAPGFGDADKARACLNDLVNERLLTSLGGGDNPNYELIHDLLATVVERSRTAREERFAKDQADRRAEADRKAKDEAENQARLARRWVCLVSVALAVASLAALFAFTEWYNATKATRETRKTKHDSNNFITFMHGSMSGIFGKAGRMDLMREINVRVITYYKDHPPEPEDLDAKHTNAVAMLQDGELLREEGQRVNVALDETQKALEIFRTLRAQNPDNPSYQRDIALGYERLGDVYHDQGNLERALKNYNDGLAIREKLATQAPENPDLQRALSLSNDEVGGVLRQKGDLAGALKKYDEGLAIAQKLTTQDPSNASWQRDLSVSYNEVGDVLSDQGDLTGALKNYNDGLAIREKLATQAPDSADWQRDLYVSYNALGGVLRQKGDLEGALKNYNAGLAIAQKLVHRILTTSAGSAFSPLATMRWATCSAVRVISRARSRTITRGLPLPRS